LYLPSLTSAPRLLYYYIIQKTSSKKPSQRGDIVKIGGVVAEFNPFHNGHAALAASIRQKGITHLVAVMSGNFVQRGDIAITEKRVRAACALSAGFDLVLELPVAWSMAPAPTFARGGVGLLAACGCVEALCFGSESGDAALLKALADSVNDPRVEDVLRTRLASGMTFAKARQQAVEEVYGTELSSHLKNPNDLLGVEYLRQAKALGWNPNLMVVRRQGVFHDALAPQGRIASASWLRAHGENRALLARYIPASCAALLDVAREDGLFPARPEMLETAILARLRRLEPKELARLPDLSEGLENRFYTAIRSAGTLGELAFSLKTKRYTMARIRRLILSAFLDLGPRDSTGTPPYLHILGFNQRGREILAEIGKHSSLPCQASLARLEKLGGRCKETAGLESRTTDLYGLALPKPLPCGYDLLATGNWKTGPGRR
jgi:predicted nucleotidyltransferase